MDGLEPSTLYARVWSMPAAGYSTAGGHSQRMRNSRSTRFTAIIDDHEQGAGNGARGG